MITAKPRKVATPKPPDAADAFIASAPDGGAVATTRTSGLMKGNQRQISHTVPPDLLDRLDALATKTGQKRAALINLAIYRLLETGI